MGPAHSVGPFSIAQDPRGRVGPERFWAAAVSGECRAVRPFPALRKTLLMTESLVGGASAAPLSMHATAVVASAIVSAARRLLTDLEQGRRIDAAVLRNAMQAAFGASDASGAWNWKTAYDACEAATVLFLRRHGAAMRAKAASPAAMLSMLMRITGLL